MIRRDFLKKLSIAGVAGAAASSVASPAIAQSTRELRMLSAWPNNSPGFGTSAARFAQRVASMSAGSLTIRVEPAGETVPLSEELKAVSAGDADMYHSFDSYYQSTSKAFNFFTGVPFGLTTAEHTAWIRFGGGREVWDELGRQFGIKGFMAGSIGMQMGGWYNRDVRSAQDYKGLKIAIRGLGGEVVRRLGGVVQPLAGHEIFSALQSGAIDAAEWFGPWLDLSYGFYKVGKYYYYPGFQEPSSVVSLGISLKTWESLSAEHKAIIESAADGENETVLAEFNAKNIDALNILVTKYKVTLRRFSDEAMRTLGETSGDVVSELGTGDAVATKVHDSFIKFRRNAVAWTKVTDQAYGEARLLPFRYGRS